MSRRALELGGDFLDLKRDFYIITNGSISSSDFVKIR